MTWITAIINVAKMLWDLFNPKKTPEEMARDGGAAEAERDNAVAGLHEVQKGVAAGQDQRGKLAADPGRVRDETAVPGAARPWNPSEPS
jgi:hypothetical protein